MEAYYSLLITGINKLPLFYFEQINQIIDNLFEYRVVLNQQINLVINPP